MSEEGFFDLSAARKHGERKKKHSEGGSKEHRRRRHHGESEAKGEDVDTTAQTQLTEHTAEQEIAANINTGEQIAEQIVDKPVVTKYPALRDDSVDPDLVFSDVDFLIRRHVKGMVPGASQSGEACQVDENTGLLSYESMLTRAFQVMAVMRGSAAIGQTTKVPPPIVERVGRKKSLWTNFFPTCQVLHRHPEHVKEFVLAELNTTASLDSRSRLLFKIRFMSKQIEQILRPYIIQYVRCETCHSLDTLLLRDGKMQVVQCENCGAHRNVSGIKAGYHADLSRRRTR